MKLYKVDITPSSLFRDLPSSYTIFGAVSWGYLLLFGEDKLNKLLDRFSNGDIPFLVSSVLPRKKDKYYFPKPNLKAKREKKSSADYKRLKKIRYIELSIFKDVLDGKIKNELELNKELEKQNQISLFDKTAVPHAVIDRIRGTTRETGGLYFEEVISLKEGFILFLFFDETIKNEIRAVLHLLQDIGLGGNRSIGYGRAIFGEFKEFKSLEPYLINRSNRFITLSPLIPEKDTYDLSDSYYDYFTFRGAVDNNYGFKNVDIWKDKVIYLKEGSTLKAKNGKDIYGQFYKAKEINGKEIYQYGLAFPLFIQGGS
ncbi:type III-A CRISPR-associated RAMP protein Csm4 [Persephonella sp.]